MADRILLPGLAMRTRPADLILWFVVDRVEDLAVNRRSPRMGKAVASGGFCVAYSVGHSVGAESTSRQMVTVGPGTGTSTVTVGPGTF
jgi:hypothetical protein